MQSPCLKVIGPSFISNKGIGIIILHTDENLICSSTMSFKFLENGVDFFLMFLNVMRF